MEGEQFDLDYVYQLLEWMKTTNDNLKGLTYLCTIIKYVFENVALIELHPEIMITIRDHCRKATVTISELIEKGHAVERFLQLIESFKSITDHLAEFDFVDEKKSEAKTEEKEPEQSSEKEPVAKALPEEKHSDEESWWNKSGR